MIRIKGRLGATALSAFPMMTSGLIGSDTVLSGAYGRPVCGVRCSLRRSKRSASSCSNFAKAVRSPSGRSGDHHHPARTAHLGPGDRVRSEHRRVEPCDAHHGRERARLRRSADRRRLATVLLGRANECETVARLLDTARSGQGDSLVVHGEPGIGKSALLAYAADSAAGFQVLRAAGNDAEAALAYAAAQQLCPPDLSALDELPVPQQEALGVAFGQITGSPPDQLFVGLALLGLLSQMASKSPFSVSSTTPSGLITNRRRFSRSWLVASDQNRSPSCSAPALSPTSSPASRN